MYASLPLSCPSRGRARCGRRPSRRRSRARARRRRRRRGRSAARRRGARCRAARRARSRLVRGVQALQDAPHDDRRTRCASGIARPFGDARAHQARERLARGRTPCTRKSFARCRRPRRASGRRSGGGCARRGAPRRGTSRRTRGPFANCGCRRLIATVREKPTGPSSAPEVHGGHAAGGDLFSERVAADDPFRHGLCSTPIRTSRRRRACRARRGAGPLARRACCSS